MSNSDSSLSRTDLHVNRVFSSTEQRNWREMAPDVSLRQCVHSAGQFSFSPLAPFCIHPLSSLAAHYRALNDSPQRHGLLCYSPVSRRKEGRERGGCSAPRCARLSVPTRDDVCRRCGIMTRYSKRPRLTFLQLSLFSRPRMPRCTRRTNRPLLVGGHANGSVMFSSIRGRYHQGGRGFHTSRMTRTLTWHLRWR